MYFSSIIFLFYLTWFLNKLHDSWKIVEIHSTCLFIQERRQSEEFTDESEVRNALSLLCAANARDDFYIEIVRENKTFMQFNKQQQHNMADDRRVHTSDNSFVISKPACCLLETQQRMASLYQPT